MKENISITQLDFVSNIYADEIPHYFDKLKKVQEQLDINREIHQSYSVNDIHTGTEVSMKHIKICRRKYKIVVFGYKIENEDWAKLIDHLK